MFPLLIRCASTFSSLQLSCFLNFNSLINFILLVSWLQGYLSQLVIFWSQNWIRVVLIFITTLIKVMISGTIFIFLCWWLADEWIHKKNDDDCVAAAFFVLFILFWLRILYILFVRLPCFHAILYSVRFFCIISLSF